MVRLRRGPDYIRDRVILALGPIGAPEAVPPIRELFTNEDVTLRLCASSALGRIKHQDSEAAMLTLLENERDSAVRTNLCLGLCKLFSRAGVDVVRREIQAGYDTILVSLEDELLVVAEVLGLSLPEAPTWRSRLQGKEEQRKHREGMLHNLLRRPTPAHEEVTKRQDAAQAAFDTEVARMPEGLSPTIRALPSVGRNDRCPCGSGKKFKKCCARRRPL